MPGTKAEVRRMDSRKILLLVGALLVAGMTAVFARTLTAGSAAPQAGAAVIVTPPPEPGPEILVATRALPVGTIIDSASLKFQPWPKELVGGAYFLKDHTDMSKLLGTVVRFAITAGQPLTQGAVVKSGDRGFLAAALTPGMRAVTVPVSAQTGVAGFVFPGDHIDVVLTQDVAGGGDGPPLKVSETILRNVRVLATDQRTDGQSGNDGKTPIQTFTTVTVEATPKIAEQLAVAQTVGTLSLSLRALADRPEDLQNPGGGAAAPVADRASYVTGGDISRYQRRTVPGRQREGSASAAPGGATTGPAATGPAATGPVTTEGFGVRVARGSGGGPKADAAPASPTNSGAGDQ